MRVRGLDTGVVMSLSTPSLARVLSFPQTTILTSRITTMATKKTTTTTTSTSTPAVLTHVTAADLLNVGKSLKQVAVPEISEGAVVYLKPLTAGVMLDFSSLAADQQAAGIVSLIANSLCDENGTSLFSNDSTGHNLVRTLPVKLFNRLSQLIVQSIGAEAVKND